MDFRKNYDELIKLVEDYKKMLNEGKAERKEFMMSLDNKHFYFLYNALETGREIYESRQQFLEDCEKYDGKFEYLNQAWAREYNYSHNRYNEIGRWVDKKTNFVDMYLDRFLQEYKI